MTETLVTTQPFIGGPWLAMVEEAIQDGVYVHFHFLNRVTDKSQFWEPEKPTHNFLATMIDLIRQHIEDPA